MSLKRNSSLVRKKYLEYLASTLAFTLSIYIASIVDGIMVSRLISPLSLTAINLTFPVLYMKNIVFCLFISGGCTLAAQAMGFRDQDKCNRAYTVSVVCGIIASGTLAAAGVIFASPLAELLTKGGSLKQEVLAYLIPLWIVGPIVVLTNGSAAYMRLEGKHRLAIAVPVVANVINLLCDYVYIKLFGLGIAGAGWATVTGYACSALLLIPYSKDASRTLHFTRLKRGDLKLLKECLATGLPISLVDGCDMLRHYTVNAMMLRLLGDTGGELISVCNAAMLYALMFSDGASCAMTSVTGALYGEGDARGMRGVLKSAMTVTGGLCLCIFLILECFPGYFAGIYGVRDPEVLSVLIPYLRIYCLAVPIVAPLYVLRCFYQSTKQEKAATAMSVLEGALIMIPVFLLLSGIGIRAMAASYAISVFLTLLVVCMYMQKKAGKNGLTGFLMLPPFKESETFEASIDCTLEASEKASEEVILFCKENGVPAVIGNAAGVATEELCTNIAKWSGQGPKDQIDLFLRISEDHLILKTRDGGTIFNPTEFIEEGEWITGLSLLRSLSARIEYDRILGFNTVIVTMHKAEEKRYLYH
ncbi:MAG: hypothetical protein IJT16_02835 [Lachnospiraceae bacterium]|nr:hypothetical protein [Lachnospiraceae bacterium]